VTQPRLPAPREPGRYSISFVCLGNICRSPMAAVVLEARLEEAGLAGQVEVSSSGTGDWHVGDPMDERAAGTLTTAGYDASRHRARRFDHAHRSTYDLLLAMDTKNLADVGGRDDRTMLFRDFDPVDPGADVPDPYYGGPAGFEEVLSMVERTTDAIVTALQGEHALR
jgi:protein-tyrosine phosphatase